MDSLQFLVRSTFSRISFCFLTPTEKSPLHTHKFRYIDYVYTFSWIQGWNGINNWCNTMPSQQDFSLSFPMLTHNKLVPAWRAGHQQASPHVCIRIQPTVCCPTQLCSVQLCGQLAMICHPASQYWLGVLEAYTKARGEVTDCVLQRTLSLHSTQEGRQNFLAQEMETTTQAGSIWLDSLKR